MRLFFALWPGAEQRQALAGLAQSLPLENARLLAPANTHLTLAFLGEVNDELYPRIAAAAENIHCGPFSLYLDRLGWWQKPKIAWVGPSSYPKDLPQLAGELHGLARNCGLRMDERPYRPHVTLARKVRAAYEEVEFTPIGWDLSEFCLVESTSTAGGVKYEVKLRWPLKIM